MTLVLIGKGLVLGVDLYLKIEVIWVLGIYIHVDILHGDFPASLVCPYELSLLQGVGLGWLYIYIYILVIGLYTYNLKEG